MNRRDFLRLSGGALAATATMAEAGMFAEFLLWLKRAPRWSFPSELSLYREPLLDEVSAVTLEAIRKQVMFDNFFVDSPIFTKLRQPRKIHGGEHLSHPLIYEGVGA